jgi:hypothetical protein
MGGTPKEKEMQYELCRHIKTNGLQCKAAALNGGIWCYFHHRLHQRHTAFRSTEATRGYLIPGQHIELTTLEDRESVQVALSVVINALAVGKLDTKRATALLYGLQLASNNARGLRIEPIATSVVRTVEPSPEGLDLAEPGAFIEEPDVALTWEAVDEDEEEQQKEDDEWVERMSRSSSKLL